MLRGAAFAFCAAIAAAGPAFAQAPDAPASRNQQATQLAQRLGSEQSAEGLEAILRAQNADLLTFYVRGFRDATMRQAKSPAARIPLRPDIEALVVKYYPDPRLGGLKDLFASGWCRYQTRELFDLLMADWRAGKRGGGVYDMRDAVLATTAPGIEPALLDFFKALPDPAASDGSAIAYFLAERQYRPAIAALAAFIRTAKPDAPRSAIDALSRLGGPEATAAMLARLAWLRDQTSSSPAASETQFLASKIGALKPEEGPGFAELRKALPATLDDNLKRTLLGYAARRKDPAGTAFALSLLQETRFYPGTLEVLVASDSPEVWKQARAEVERLKPPRALNEGQYRYASTMLDAKIADPQKHFAEKRQADRGKELQARQSALGNVRGQAREIRDRDPEKYVAAVVEDLRARERLAEEFSDISSSVGLRGEIATGYVQLAHFVRFRLKRPAQAIELYAAAGRNGNGLGDLGVADTYQFDVRDPAKALAQYQSLLDKQRHPSAMRSSEESIGAWTGHWLESQVEFLRSGKRYSGTVGLEDLGAVAMIMYYGGGGGGDADDGMDLSGLNRLWMAAQQGGKIDRAVVARELAGLPVSSFALMRTAAFVGYLPDARSIREYLAKLDPAGYASAGYFAIVELADRPAERGGQMMALVPALAAEPQGAANPLRIAARQFLAERRITVPSDLPVLRR